MVDAMESVGQCLNNWHSGWNPFLGRRLSLFVTVQRSCLICRSAKRVSWCLFWFPVYSCGVSPIYPHVPCTEVPCCATTLGGPFRFQSLHDNSRPSCRRCDNKFGQGPHAKSGAPLLHCSEERMVVSRWVAYIKEEHALVSRNKWQSNR